MWSENVKLFLPLHYRVKAGYRSGRSSGLNDLVGDAREGGVEARAFLDTEVLWLDIFRHVLADLLTGRKVVEFLHVSSNPFLIDNDFASLRHRVPLGQLRI